MGKSFIVFAGLLVGYALAACSRTPASPPLCLKETLQNDSVVATNISYTMVWRHDPDVHFFFSYPGHPGVKYTRDLLNSKAVWLLDNKVQRIK